MSNNQEGHRSSSSSETSRNDWIDGERPINETISESICTTQMRPTNVEEDIIGYATAFAHGNNGQMGQMMEQGDVASTFSMIETGGGSATAPVTGASGIMPRSHINSQPGLITGVHPVGVSTSGGVVETTTTTTVTSRKSVTPSSVIVGVPTVGIATGAGGVVESSTTVTSQKTVPPAGVTVGGPPFGMSTGGGVVQSSSTTVTSQKNVSPSGVIVGGPPVGIATGGGGVLGSSTTVTSQNAGVDCSVVSPTLPIVPSGQRQVDCCKYEINKDPNPIVVVKHPDQPIKYDQNIGVRYLKPPTPPPSGPIIVKEVRPPPVPEAPPLYVKLRPQRPPTPPPLIIREAPPLPPKPLPTQIIHKVLPPAPPPPRKVIVEKLPPLPPKPRSVIIEKWLPYEKRQREIIYQRLPDLPPQAPVKNTLINWAPFKSEVTKRYHNLGVVRADPAAYGAQHALEIVGTNETMNAMAQYGAQLHYQDAAGAHISGDHVYVENKAELDRLMHTNFHPNDPVCKQYIAAAASGSQFGMTMPCPPPTIEDSHQARLEAQSMAAMYSAQYPPGSSVPVCPPPCGGGDFIPMMESAYGIEFHGMGGMESHGMGAHGMGSFGMGSYGMDSQSIESHGMIGTSGPPPICPDGGPPIFHDGGPPIFHDGGPPIFHDGQVPPIYQQSTQMYPSYCENAECVPPPPQGPFLG